MSYRHGTHAGYQQHKTRGEEACQSCLDGHNAYVKQLRSRNPKILTRQTIVAKRDRLAVAELRRRHFAEYEQILAGIRLEDVIVTRRRKDTAA